MYTCDFACVFVLIHLHVHADAYCAVSLCSEFWFQHVLNFSYTSAHNLIPLHHPTLRTKQCSTNTGERHPATCPTFLQTYISVFGTVGTVWEQAKLSRSPQKLQVDRNKTRTYGLQRGIENQGICQGVRSSERFFQLRF